MKKLRKSLAIILAVLMLMSIVPLQSFAALNFGNLEITAIAFKEETPVSMKEIEMLHSFYGKDKISLNNTYYNEDDIGTGFYYDNILVSLSNGKTVELDKLFDEMPEIGSYEGPHITVSYDDCKNAIENGDDTVPVKVQLRLYYGNGKSAFFDDKVDVRIVESSDIKSIKPVGELDPFYKGMYYCDYFIGLEMEIEYTDGTKKTATITEGEFKGSIGPLELDGRPLVTKMSSVSVGFDQNDNEIVINLVRFALGDAVYQTTYEIVESPYKRIDIVDYKIEKDNVLTNITYDITKTNGEKETYTKDCNITDFTDAVKIDTLGAYRVEVDISVDIASFAENSFGALTIYLGNGGSDDFDGSYRFFDSVLFDGSEHCSCICHKKGISKLIYLILIKIWNLFGINDQCKCGAWHWDE